MIATVKIIPFAVARRGARCRAWRSRARPRRWSGSRPIASARSAWSRRCCRGSPTKVIEKTLKVTAGAAGAGRRQHRRRAPRAARAGRAGARRSTRCSSAGAELVIVFGASAIADRRDVIPAAVEAIGGRIEHFGMPVDPGNLMLLGRGARPAGARRAGLRALAQGERLRLGADAAARRPCRCRARTITGWASAAC